MSLLSVLDVGHGLCVVVDAYDQAFVFDCGEHFSHAKTPLSRKRLNERAACTGRIEAIAVSHLHYDHYCGLLGPIHNVRSNLRVIYAPLPNIKGYSNLLTEFAYRLNAYTPLDPRLGPLHVDLLMQMRLWVPDLIPRPVFEGRVFALLVNVGEYCGLQKNLILNVWIFLLSEGQ